MLSIAIVYVLHMVAFETACPARTKAMRLQRMWMWISGVWSHRQVGAQLGSCFTLSNFLCSMWKDDFLTIWRPANS